MSEIEKNNDKIKELCENYNVSSLRLFGSRLYGKNTPESDVDLIIDFSKKISLLTLVKIERELSEIIGKKVDLLTEASISPYIKQNIIKEAKVIYHA